MRSVPVTWIFVFFRLGWIHVTTHRGRTLLTILGVGLGVAATVAVQTANVNVLRSFEESVLTVAGPVTLQVLGGAGGMDERFIRRVREVAGVESTRPVLEVSVRTVQSDGRIRSLTVLGLDLLEELGTRQGRIPATLSSIDGETDGLGELFAPEGLLLGHALALELGVKVGQQILVDHGNRELTLSVAAIMNRPVGALSAWDRIAVMDIAVAQRTFDLIGRLDRIDVITDKAVSVEAVAEAVRQVAPPAVTVRRPIQRSRQVEAMVRAFQMNLSVLSMVGLLVGTFLIYNTIAFAVAQRRREVGILRAIGMSEAMVAGLFLAEAGLLGLAGGAIGGGLGLALGHVLVGLVGRTIQDLYVPLGTVPQVWQGLAAAASLLQEALLIGSVVSLCGALGPSLDAGRTVVVAALAQGAYDVAQHVRVTAMAKAGLLLLLIAAGSLFLEPIGGVPVFGYLATFCILAGLSCLVPVLIQQVCRTRRLGGGDAAPNLGGAIRHIAREQTVRGIGRNAVTVSAFLVGVAIMVGVMVMIRSFRATVEIWINQTVMADFIVAPAGWPHVGQEGAEGTTLPFAWQARLAETEHVSAVDTYRDVRIEIQGRSIALVSRDLALHAARSRYLFIDGDPSTILRRAAAGDGVIVSEVLANALRVTTEDRLSVMTPAGEQMVTVLGVFFDYATDGGKIVMDRALYHRWWKDTAVTVFPVYTNPGSDLEQARGALEETLARVPHSAFAPIVLSNAELRREILRIFDRTFALTYVLEAIAVIIAMLGIVNTLVTSVVERRRELATLQAIGGSPGQVTALILWEAGYLGLLGTAMGLVGGFALAWILIRVINRQSFGWTIQLSWPFGLTAEIALMALAAALVAGLWPARWAARQPLIDGLRYE